MRLARLLLPAFFATACAVPDVTFATDGGGPSEAASDAARDTSTDAGNDAASIADHDGDAAAADASDTGSVDASDGAAGDARDGGNDGPAYCTGDAGPPSGDYTCCPSGAVCSGTCNGPSCNHCGTCSWPNVCCTSGSSGDCKPPGSC